MKSIKVYKHFVLLNILQVIDKELQFDEAIRACKLCKTLTKQRLHYFVAKEMERRRKDSCEQPREGRILVTTERNTSHQEADNTTSVTVTSPLTSTTSKISTRPCTPRPRKKSRRLPRQASEARLDTKEVRDDLRKWYSSAF